MPGADESGETRSGDARGRQRVGAVREPPLRYQPTVDPTNHHAIPRIPPQIPQIPIQYTDIPLKSCYSGL